MPESTLKPVTMTLESTLESVDKAEAAAEQVAADVGIPEDDRYQISMAVREGMVNAVMHGNAYDPEKTVSLSFEQEPGTLRIRIADQGAGLDINDIPDPLAPENIMRGSGRGIFLIRSFMDDVQFRKLSPGTEMTLVKHLPMAPAGA